MIESWVCPTCGERYPSAPPGTEPSPVGKALDDVRLELERALAKFGPFASAHEGYAVIQEEVDELWQEVKHGSRASARPEAVQVAAMAVRFLIDLYGQEETDGVG